MSIYVGIEGGGTKTRILFQRDDDPPEYVEREISLKVKRQNFPGAANMLYGTLLLLLLDRFEEIVSIAIGLAGMSRPEDQELLKRAINDIPAWEKVKVHVETDATLTLSSVLPPGEEGILLIAGTGSVVFFQPRGGTAHRIGGWGPLLSDEGGGYRIGLRALRYYVKVLDGVYPPEPLSMSISKLLPKKAREDRFEITRMAEKDARFVASLAPLAFANAGKDGPVRDLVFEEMIDLVTSIFPVFFPNVMSGETPYKLYLSGSIAKHPIMLDILSNAFDAKDMSAIPVDDHIPSMKALEIARGL